MTGVLSRVGGLFTSDGFKNYLESLRYGLFTMRRPMVGFWDLIHEKRGTMAAAHTFVVLMIIVEIMRITMTNFQFILVYLDAFNVFFAISQILLPIFLWSVANWSLTTLMDGKGRLGDIYMGTAYALVPMIIIRAALIPVSHIITHEEGMIYWTANSIGVIWFVMLLLVAMMEIHDYTMSKTILSSIFTVVATGIIIFVFVIFFAVVSDGVTYFISLGREIIFRMR